MGDPSFLLNLVTGQLISIAEYPELEIFETGSAPEICDLRTSW